MLIAESFVLLALDPDGSPARGHSNQSAVAVGVTGALITELVQAGHVDLVDDRIRITGTQPEDSLLAQVLTNVAPFEGKKLRSRFTSIKHSGWSETVDRMIGNGILGREKEFLQPTRHPVLVPETQQMLLQAVRAAAIGTGPIDADAAALLALAGPCQLLEVVAPERRHRKQAKRRIAEAAAQVPAAKAVKAVIAAMSAAIIATTTTTAVIASS